MSVFLQPIYSQTIGGSSVASITFNNIPQGFTDLKVVFSCRSSYAGTNDQIIVRFNGDTGLNYSYTNFYGADANATGTYRGAGLDRFFSIWLNGANSTANYFNNAEMYISNYTGGNSKNIILDSVTGLNGTSGNVQSPSAALWRNPAPITSMTFTANGNFVQYSTVTVYGVSAFYDTRTPTAPTIGTVTDLAEFASVAFTAAANDQAESYVVTSSPSGSTTYGAVSPIVTPAVLGTSYTYQVASVNSLGTSTSSASTALTTFNSYASIATVNATGSESSFNFTNIPQGYKHLEIRAHVRCTLAGSGLSNLAVRYNADGGTNYNYTSLYGTRSGVPSQGTTFSQAVGYVGTCVPQASATTNAFGGYTISIVDYASTTKIKTTKSLAGGDIVSSGVVSEFSMLWNSTAPITSITVYAEGNFANYSSIALYGIA